MWYRYMRVNVGIWAEEPVHGPETVSFHEISFHSGPCLWVMLTHSIRMPPLHPPLLILGAQVPQHLSELFLTLINLSVHSTVEALNSLPSVLLKSDDPDICVHLCRLYMCHYTSMVKHPANQVKRV